MINKLTGVLLIVHAPLASAFAQVARDMGLPTSRLAALDITPTMTREDAFCTAKMLAADMGCDRWLILVDLGGCCSPYIVASELRDALGHKARVVPGLNVAMLATALCDEHRDIDSLASHVSLRGSGQAVSLPPCRDDVVTSEENVAIEVAEDNRLRSIGIDPGSDPIDIMIELERRHEQRQEEDARNAEA